jgi:hypothetical protein
MGPPEDGADDRNDRRGGQRKTARGAARFSPKLVRTRHDLTIPVIEAASAQRPEAAPIKGFGDVARELQTTTAREGPNSRAPAAERLGRTYIYPGGDPS